MISAQQYIAGQWLPGAADAPLGDCLDPARGAVAAHFHDASVADVRAAIGAARHAFETTSWARQPRLRSDVLRLFADRLEARTQEVATLLVLLNGKLRREALGEIAAGISELRYYAGLARNVFGRSIEVEPGCWSQLEREAIGVAAIIVPWNAPVTLLVRSLAPALAAGCTVVIKAAHQTAPVHQLVMECLTADVRIPPGVINSFVESAAAGAEALCADPEVDVISFTGSTRVGKAIARSASQNLTRLSLELGGKAPAIVFEDADIDAAVRGIVAGGTVMAGQMCTAIARVIVHASIRGTFTERLANALQAVRVGPGDDAQSQMGPVIDRGNRDRLLTLVEQAHGAGAKVLHQGSLPAGLPAAGAFIAPSLVAAQELSSRFIQDELFGPLLVLETFQSEADAVLRANATRYGLAASLWGRDHARMRRVARLMKTGTIWLNTHNRLFPEAETGGYRESGRGRLHGVEGLNDFLETKHIYHETGALGST
jgi:betaine-aldehyde dehydrogenase